MIGVSSRDARGPVGVTRDRRGWKCHRCGVKGGTTYGKTDQFGHKVIERGVSVHDFHATILHLLGLHHQKLFFKRSGLEERLTGFEIPRVVTEILS